jgi:hypothetical protein
VRVGEESHYLFFPTKTIANIQTKNNFLKIAHTIIFSFSSLQHPNFFLPRQPRQFYTYKSWGL